MLQFYQPFITELVKKNEYHNWTTITPLAPQLFSHATGQDKYSFRSS